LQDERVRRPWSPKKIGMDGWLELLSTIEKRRETGPPPRPRAQHGGGVAANLKFAGHFPFYTTENIVAMALRCAGLQAAAD
jgi:hypothetical protein